MARLLAKGLTYQAVADQLVVSYHTVKKHVQNIYQKCGVNSRFQLYRWMERNDPQNDPAHPEWHPVGKSRTECRK